MVTRLPWFADMVGLPLFATGVAASNIWWGWMRPVAGRRWIRGTGHRSVPFAINLRAGAWLALGLYVMAVGVWAAALGSPDVGGRLLAIGVLGGPLTVLGALTGRPRWLVAPAVRRGPASWLGVAQRGEIAVLCGWAGLVMWIALCGVESWYCLQHATVAWIVAPLASLVAGFVLQGGPDPDATVAAIVGPGSTNGRRAPPPGA